MKKETYHYLTEEQFEILKDIGDKLGNTLETIKSLCKSSRDDINMGFELGTVFLTLKDWQAEAMLLIDDIEDNRVDADDIERLKSDIGDKNKENYENIMKKANMGSEGSFEVNNSKETNVVPKKEAEPLPGDDINIGDKVVITDSGRVYPNYKGMFKMMGFKNENENYCDDITGIFTVFAKGNHFDDEKVLLFGIEDETRQLLFNAKGIKKAEEKTADIQERIYVAEKTADVGVKNRTLLISAKDIVDAREKLKLWGMNKYTSLQRLEFGDYGIVDIS